jgi:hypothetical protein
MDERHESNSRPEFSSESIERLRSRRTWKPGGAKGPKAGCAATQMGKHINRKQSDAPFIMADNGQWSEGHVGTSTCNAHTSPWLAKKIVLDVLTIFGFNIF